MTHPIPMPPEADFCGLIIPETPPDTEDSPPVPRNSDDGS